MDGVCALCLTKFELPIDVDEEDVDEDVVDEEVVEDDDDEDED